VIGGLAVLLGTAIFSKSSPVTLALVTVIGGALGALSVPAWTFVSAYMTQPRRNLQERMERLERGGRGISEDPELHALKRLVAEGEMLVTRLKSLSRVKEIRPEIETWEGRTLKAVSSWPGFETQLRATKPSESVRSSWELRSLVELKTELIRSVIAHLEGGGK
jgi:hypothetical protein